MIWNCGPKLKKLEAQVCTNQSKSREKCWCSWGDHGAVSTSWKKSTSHQDIGTRWNRGLERLDPSWPWPTGAAGAAGLPDAAGGAAHVAQEPLPPGCRWGHWQHHRQHGAAQRHGADGVTKLRMVGAGARGDGCRHVTRELDVPTVASGHFSRGSRKLGGQIGISKSHGVDVELRSPGSCCPFGALAKFQLMACSGCSRSLCFEDDFDRSKEWCFGKFGPHHRGRKTERWGPFQQCHLGPWYSHSGNAVDAQHAANHLGIEISGLVQFEAMLVCILSPRTIFRGRGFSENMCARRWLYDDLRWFERTNSLWPWLFLHGILFGSCKSCTLGSPGGFFDASPAWENVPLRMRRTSTWIPLLHCCHTARHVSSGLRTSNLSGNSGDGGLVSPFPVQLCFSFPFA